MDATFHLDGQRELDIVLALCGIDGHQNKRIALNISRSLDGGIGSRTGNARDLQTGGTSDMLGKVRHHKGTR